MMKNLLDVEPPSVISPPEVSDYEPLQIGECDGIPSLVTEASLFAVSIVIASQKDFVHRNLLNVDRRRQH